MSKKWLLWLSLCFIGGCYIRHWMHTGTGQFKRLKELIGDDW